MKIASWIQAGTRMITRWVAEDLDLLALWVALWAAQGWIPPGSALARPDFAPWMAFVCCAVALLRGRGLGEGAHPALARRSDRFGAVCRRLAIGVGPAVVFAWFEAGQSGRFGVAISGTMAQLGLLVFGQRHGSTAWRPGHMPEVLAWILTGAGAAVLSMAAQGFALLLGSESIAVAAQLGLGFLLTGLTAGSPRHLAQRRAAGRADATPWRPRLFVFALATLGPAMGWLILIAALGRARGASVPFDLAYIPTLYCIAWGRIMWPRPRPIARTVLLHEVTPSGGWDSQSEGRARSFSDTPLGSLRFSPLRVRRTRVVHTWVVPVLAPRVATADDPVRPLWPPPPVPAPQHALGEGRFEPDPYFNMIQTEVLTVHVVGGADDKVYLHQDALARRVLVLRPFPGGLWRESGSRLYQWESALPDESVQVLDSGARIARLRDGDLLLLASGGRARAYELEFAKTLDDPFLLELGRPPQLEDYVKVSA